MCFYKNVFAPLNCLFLLYLCLSLSLDLLCLVVTVVTGYSWVYDRLLYFSNTAPWG